jgi:hypothetical protein
LGAAADALGAAGAAVAGVGAGAGVGGLVAGVAGDVLLPLMAVAVTRVAWTLRMGLMVRVLAMQQLRRTGPWPTGSTLDICLDSSGSSESREHVAQPMCGHVVGVVV